MKTRRTAPVLTRTSPLNRFRSPLTGYNKYGPADVEAAREVLASGRLFYPYGSRVRHLAERLRAEYCAAGCTLVSSGTAAVHVGLGSVGVDFGDEVITTPITDTGTVIPIFLQGAVPVFADVSDETMMITADTIRRVLSPRTRAIVVVHYGGFPAEMAAILDLASRNGIAVVEDCCQAQGTLYQGSRVGVLGDAGCFSTNDTKHASCGDGGFVLTRSGEYAHRARLFHDKGFDRATDERNPAFVAPNYRMTELQAAVLDVQWSALEDRLKRRAAFALALDERLSRFEWVRPVRAAQGDRSSYFSYLFSVAADAPQCRDDLVGSLQARGIPAQPGNLFDVQYRLKIFGPALPRYMQRLDHPDYAAQLCPIAERTHAAMVRLPVFETFGDEEVAAIAAALEALSVRHGRGPRPTRREAR